MNFKSFLPHLLAILIFFLVTIVLFHPGILKGKVLNQHDILQWQGAAQELIDFRNENGEEALWTNSMFSGMPAFLVSTKYSGDLFLYVQKAIGLGISRPFNLVFIAFISLYILLSCFKVSPGPAVLSAIAYGATTFVIIGLMAGHNSRIAAIAFLPLVVAGVKLVFDKKYAWGFLLTACGLALEIRVNHLQITYYLLLILVVFGIFHLVSCIRNKSFDVFKIQIPILLLSVILAVGANYGKLKSILDYSKYSTRGKSELSVASSESGLEKDYAFEFSNGITEPLVLFIPNIYGGASNESLSDKSKVAQALKDQGVSRVQINQMLSSVPTYWGDQRLSAPYYVGAVVVFLFVLALFVLDWKTKGWLLIVTILGVVLSWGDNFSAFNYFFFDFLPGYNKFRSVTFTLLISIFGISVLAALGLDKFLKSGNENIKQLLYAGAVTGGLAVLVMIYSSMGSFRGAVDAQLQQLPDWYIDALREDRARLMRLDAIRSGFLVGVAMLLLWLTSQDKLKKVHAVALIVLVSAADVILVSKRYLKADLFQEEVNETYFQKTAADQLILEATNPGDRVLNLQNPFNESKTSYFHNSIGGYHGAKLGRYQELIENHLSPEINEMITGLQSGQTDFSGLYCINMLNTKFLKYGDQAGNVIQNPSAFGNAWFVQTVEEANNPDEEIELLGQLNSKNEVVADITKFDVPTEFELDSMAIIKLENRQLNEITYSSSSSKDGLIVFSEIYYPEGWTAQIDGNEVPILRANYVLRALEVPAGNHQITFEFKPKYFKKANTIMAVSFFLIIGLSGGFFFVFRGKSDNENGENDSE